MARRAVPLVVARLVGLLVALLPLANGAADLSTTRACLTRARVTGFKSPRGPGYIPELEFMLPTQGSIYGGEKMLMVFRDLTIESSKPGIRFDKDVYSLIIPSEDLRVLNTTAEDIDFRRYQAHTLPNSHQLFGWRGSWR